MAKLSRARVSITGALLGLLLAVGTMGQGAGAEGEPSAPEITEPAAPSPDPIEPPVAVQPTPDIPAPEPDEPPAVVTQPAPPEQEPNVVRSPAQSSTGGATRRKTTPPSPSTTPTPVEVGAFVALSPAPAPNRSPKPEPATLWHVDYTSSTGSGPPALAVVALGGSLGLAVLLGVGYLVHQTRMANRLPKSPFSRR